MKNHIAAVIIATNLLASPAWGAVEKFNFVARVDQVDTFVPTGTLIKGQFSYDNEIAPKLYYSGRDYITALYSHPSIQLSFSFSDINFSNGGQALVADHVSGLNFPDDGDAFSVGKYGSSVQYSIYIWQPDGEWLTNTSLPTVYPTSLWQGPFADPNDDDNVEHPHGEFNFWDAAQSRSFTALVLSVTPTSTSAVPEPRTWAMMLVGFVTIGTTFRRRRKISIAAKLG